MKTIILWGGTIEGREITEYLMESDVLVHVCVATGYGKDLLPEADNIVVHAGRLDAEEMAGLLEELKPELGIDATHPYAVDVSKNIRQACAEKNVPYLRVKRNEANLKVVTDEASGEGTLIGDSSSAGSEGAMGYGAEPPADSPHGSSFASVTVDNAGTQAVETGQTHGSHVVVAENTEEAIVFLEKTEGNIFLTTGSKELAAYTKLTDYQDRVIARVLSSAEVVQMCRDLGFPGRHIIAAQGPFGEEINYAMLKEYEAAWMVTKNTGDAGGFQAKWDAAIRAGVNIVVIGRPAEQVENTLSLEELEEYLKDNYHFSI